MLVATEIDFDQLREDRLQREYLEDHARLTAAYEQARLNNDHVKMASVARALNDL